MTVAAVISPGGDMGRTIEYARTAEELGYDAVFTTHILNRDALITAAWYGQATSRVRVGTAVYPAFLMTAVALGQLAASIDEMVAGRFILGLGTSHRPVIEGWHGLEFPAKPVTAMRETVTALRSLFTTGRVQMEGTYVRSGGFALVGFTPRADLPIYLAALRPKMLQLVGELADGALLWLCVPSYIRDVVVPHIATGAQRTDRDPANVAVVPAVPCCVTDDPAPAYDALRGQVLPYMTLPFYRRMLSVAGFDDELAPVDAHLARGDGAAATAAIPQRLLDALAAVGPAETVRAKLAEYRAAGATMPAVAPFRVEGSEDVATTLAAAVGR